MEFCMTLEYFSLGKRTLGKDRKFVSFRIITSYLKMSGMTCTTLSHCRCYIFKNMGNYHHPFYEVILKLFWQWGIFCFLFDHLPSIGTPSFNHWYTIGLLHLASQLNRQSPPNSIITVLGFDIISISVIKLID